MQKEEESTPENILTLNIYSYLRSTLQTAICKKFPDISVRSESIPLFFKSPLPSADLNSPVALKISPLRKMPAIKVAEQILSCFEWDEKFIISDPDLSKTIYAGFICFRTSLSFQYDALKKAASDMNCYSDYDGTDLFNIYHMVEQTHSLLKHSERIISSYNIFEPGHFDLLINPDERQLIRLISVSQTEELYSSGAAIYFLQQMIQILKHYLRTVPVFSSNDQLSFSRVIMVRACHYRLLSLIKCRNESTKITYSINSGA